MPILYYVATSYKFNKIKNYVAKYCEEHQVSESLVISIAYVESKFTNTAVSNKGAVGVMQIMPSTAEFIGKKYGIQGYNDLKNAKINIELGVTYLKYLIEKYDSEIIAIASYNAGEGNVIKWLDKGRLKVENIPFKETKNYLKKVLKVKKIVEKRNFY